MYQNVMFGTSSFYYNSFLDIFFSCHYNAISASYEAY